MGRRWLTALELATPLVVVALFWWQCRGISVNASDRMGQVSAIAAVEWRLLLFALPLFAGLVILARWRDGVHFALASRFACAAVAGLASAAVAGGLVAMLHNTKFGLGAVGGDAGVLIDWANLAKDGKVGSSVYPPLQPALLAFMSKLSGVRTEYCLQAFQIAGVALMGPVGYGAWRLVLKPTGALFVGVIAALPLIEAYRQIPLLVLVVMVPVLVKFLSVLRRSGDAPLGQTLRCGAAFGLGLGTLFLLYSGWFQWSGPGFVVAALIVFPWRNGGWKQGMVLCGVAAVVFGLLAYRYVTGVVTGTGVVDNYMYFDATLEPMFVAMWKGGLPGSAGGAWPPIGELGGVGLFTILLCAGLATSVALARKRSLVIGIGCILTGTFLFRLWHAHRMFQTKLVQLWPRTTAELLYLLLLLTCFAIYVLFERAKKQAAEDSILHTPGPLIGALVGLVLLIGSASSATIDKYMPKDNEAEYGHLAWVALHHPPVEANQLTIGSSVVASSALETEYWSEGGAIDHKLWRGYSSKLGIKTDHEEWLELDMRQQRRFSRVLFYPAMDGAPIRIAVDVWDGNKYIEDTVVDNFAQTYMWPVTIKLTGRHDTWKLRIRATKLRQIEGGDYVFRCAEIELYE